MLIQMLFDGLFQSLNAARGAIERGDIEEKGSLSPGPSASCRKG
jgi:flagellar protein FliS